MTRPRTLALLLPLALLAAGPLAGQQQAPKPPKLHKVGHQRLAANIVEAGTLDTAQAEAVYCRLRAADKTRPAAVIKWRVEDGTPVRKGQLLIQFEDAELLERVQNQRFAVEQAKASLLQAEQDHRGAHIQAELEIRTAEKAQTLAELDSKVFEDGTAPQKALELKARVLRAEADVALWAARVEKAEALVAKGTLTVGAAQARKLRLASARAVLEQAVSERNVWEKLTRRRSEEELKHKLVVARLGVEVAKAQARAKEVQATAAVEARRLACKTAEDRLRGLQEELAACQVLATQDGMAVWASTAASRTSRNAAAFGGGIPGRAAAEPARPLSGTNLSVGAQVREGQKLMTVMDMSRPVVRTNVPEAVVSGLRVGQPAVIHIHAFPDRALVGRVMEIAQTPSAADWLQRDAKTYPTVIAIDDRPIGLALKPGMTAQVTIVTGKELARVLTVPQTALVRLRAAGQAVCQVRTAKGVEARPVVFGASDGQMVEIKEGLKEGEEVLEVVTEREGAGPGRSAPPRRE